MDLDCTDGSDKSQFVSIPISSKCGINGTTPDRKLFEISTIWREEIFDIVNGRLPSMKLSCRYSFWSLSSPPIEMGMTPSIFFFVFVFDRSKITILSSSQITPSIDKKLNTPGSHS
jgi:hypothetical protein